MEIRVIPSKIKKHTVYYEEEIRILRSIEEMVERAYVSSQNQNVILQSVRRLRESIKRKNEIFEDLEETLENQEKWVKEYVDSLRESQRR